MFQTPHRTTGALCDTAAHEVGHTMGLDHSRTCGDVMSYESCGAKTFQNAVGRCGEWDARPCADGSGVQNSWDKLASLVGRSDVAGTVATTPVRRTPPPPSAASLGITVGPARAHSTYEVTVDARDPDGIASVELIWYDQRARRLTCGESNAARPFSCVRRGSRYTFRIPVRTGTYKFVARFTDGTGAMKRTVAYQATFR